VTRPENDPVIRGPGDAIGAWEGEAMYKTLRTETPHDPTIPARPGWEGLFVHWLADRDRGNT